MKLEFDRSQGMTSGGDCYDIIVALIDGRIVGAVYGPDKKDQRTIMRLFVSDQINGEDIIIPSFDNAQQALEEAIVDQLLMEGVP